MKTQTDTNKKLLRRFHTVCNGAGIDADSKRAIVASYGHESSKDMSDAQLVDAIAKLTGQKLKTDADADADRWRKRVMAVVGAWLRRGNYNESADNIKAIACRAAGTESFNRITTSKLRAIYYEFVQKNAVASQVQNLKHEFEVEQTKHN